MHPADLHPSPYPFPGRLREECLAIPRMRQGLGLAQEWGIGGEARCMVRATLQTCLWELTNCPRIWLGPLEHLPLPTDTFLSVPT